MHNWDWYIVYDNRDDRIVYEGTYSEVIDYLECEGRYKVVGTSK